MTIASALTALNQDIQAARTAITTKGGTVTSNGGSSQLATDIATIPSGSTPTGTISITTNGTYDVTNYASADVNVSGGGSDNYPTVVAIENIMYGTNATAEASLATAGNDISQFLYGVDND